MPAVVTYFLDSLFHLVYSVLSLLRRRFIFVDVARQNLYVIEYGRCVDVFKVSTASRGVGEKEDSFRTPRGWFQVVERYGDDAPSNMVFKGRKAVGLLSEGGAEYADPVLARILRLSGCQFVNANTYSRYIYIHGAQSERMDKNKPLSQGCVNLYTSDIIDLYSDVSGSERLWVYIVDRKNLLWLQPCFYCFSEQLEN